MKFLCTAFLFFFTLNQLSAQDFIVKNNAEVVRGTIKGTDNLSVFISVDDQDDLVLPAKEVSNFFWNGDSYVSKGFANGKNMDYRFLKALEIGSVNLYTFGGGNLGTAPRDRKVRFSPSIGIGGGTGSFGNFGGMGVGAGISFGGGNRNSSRKSAENTGIKYFIEKAGTGPMQEIDLKTNSEEAKITIVKNILIQKMGDQATIQAKIEQSADFNSKDILELVKEYNATKK